MKYRPICQVNVIYTAYYIYSFESNENHGFKIVIQVHSYNEQFRTKLGLGQFGEISHVLIARNNNICNEILLKSHFKYSQVSGSLDSDVEEDDLLFGVESVDDSVFPLVPDSMVDSEMTHLDSIPEDRVPADPLGATFRDDPNDSDEDLLV